jgi:hypothetical protein
MSITNGLIPQYALRQGAGVATKADAKTIIFKGKMKVDRAKFKALLKKRPMFFCIQDGVVKPNKKAEAGLKKFFETYFPRPAPWEKPEQQKPKKG